MGHNIAEISGQAAIMSVGPPPWHGLGTQLSAPATALEAIRAAKLDWQVEKAPLHTKVNGKERTLLHKFAVIRRDGTPQQDVPVLGVVGDGYVPLQNGDAFTWFDPIVGENAAVYYTAGALGQGERIWILAKLPKEIRVIGDDIAEKYLLLSNSHDGDSGVQVKFTPVRVVCQNTLTMALSDGPTLRVKHTRRMDERLQLARQNLGIITARLERIEMQFQSLAKTR